MNWGNIIRWILVFPIQKANLVEIQSIRFRWYSFVFERKQSRLVIIWSSIHISDEPMEPNPTPVLESFPGQHALGGVIQPGLNTAALCIMGCSSRLLCKALDFESEDDSCWFHSESTACTSLNDRSSATHYRLQTCCEFSNIASLAVKIQWYCDKYVTLLPLK